MKQLLFTAIFIVATLIACKNKDSNTPADPTATISPMDKLPDASTGWNIAPCKLIDEDYLRQSLKIEDVAIALIPNVAQNNQAASYCTYRWLKSNLQTIEAENKKLQAIADKKKTTFSPLSTINTIVISYTGKYADAAAAAATIDVAIKDERLGKQITVTGAGDKAIWNAQMNQLTVQKRAYVFYVQCYTDPKKNLEYAKQLANDVCKKI